MKIIDMIGKRFERLVVIERVGKDNRGKYLWLCRCDCGNNKIVLGEKLRSGWTKSCGCLNIEKIKLRFTKHKMTGTSIYNIWKSMNQRCNNPNNKRYKDYGGRGIKICYRWSNKNQKGFENFYKDVGDPPKGLTLDRTNNNGNYTPKNFRWVNYKQQNNNRRSRKLGYKRSKYKK